jgi:plastocyanin
MRGKGILLSLAALALGVLPGCSTGAYESSAPGPSSGQPPKSAAPAAQKTAAAPAAVVEMTPEPAFNPKRVTIRAGQTVEWRNDSERMHTVTGDPAAAANPADVSVPAGSQPFNSGPIEPHGIYRHTFDRPGTYKYVCTSHERGGMTGEIIVQP